MTSQTLPPPSAGVPAGPAAPAIAGRWLARFGRRTLDVVYPAHCPGCGSAVADAGALCGPCWQTMPFITRPFCERLGTPFAYDQGGSLLSPAAIADPPVFDRARAVARHDGLARSMVHRLKFSDRLDLARPMGGLMAVAGKDVLAGADALVPVPLHWTRLLWRRFNQAEVLADWVGRESGLAVLARTLRRRKHTPQQVGLSRPQRIANLQGAFVVRPDQAAGIEGKHLVLIDDVHTTGATLNACARVLRRAGAARIDVLTFTKVADEA
ncbi:MAG TPA: ComF family protein [Beijerinckiaceae bacterium]|nr:ComF family protein [Beijerinckiaceae bacterium]